MIFPQSSYKKNAQLQQEQEKKVREDGEMQICKQKLAKYRVITHFPIHNEYEKFILLESNKYEGTNIRRCTYRHISTRKRRNLVELFKDFDTIISDPSILQSEIRVRYTKKVKDYFEMSLHTSICINENSNQTFQEQWKIHLSLPHLISPLNLSYEQLIYMSSFTTIDYNIQMKTSLLSFFPLTETRKSPSSWTHIMNDNQLLLKLCEIVTLSTTEGKIVQFQTHLRNQMMEQSHSCRGQQLKFIQESSRRKDLLNTIQQIQGFKQNSLDFDNSNRRQTLDTNEIQDNNDDESSSNPENLINNKSNLKQKQKSSYHGLSRLLLYSILDLFKTHNMTNLEVPLNVQEQLSKIVSRLKKSGKYSIKEDSEDLAVRVVSEEKKSKRTDFYNHSHYNALFLILNPTTIRQMRESFKDVQIHKYVFGIDITNVLLEKSQIAFINILKAFSYHIFSSSLSEFLGQVDNSKQKRQSDFVQPQLLDQPKQQNLPQLEKQPLSGNNAMIQSNQSVNKKQVRYSQKQNPTFQITQKDILKSMKEKNNQSNNIRKKYLKRVVKSIEFLSKGFLVLRF